jgi:hypothetical protein
LVPVLVVLAPAAAEGTGMGTTTMEGLRVIRAGTSSHPQTTTTLTTTTTSTSTTTTTITTSITEYMQLTIHTSQPIPVPVPVRVHASYTSTTQKGLPSTLYRVCAYEFLLYTY